MKISSCVEKAFPACFLPASFCLTLVTHYRIIIGGTLLVFLISCQKTDFSDDQMIDEIVRHVESGAFGQMGSDFEYLANIENTRSVSGQGSSCRMVPPRPIAAMMNKIFKLQSRRADSRCEESPWKAPRVCGIRWQHGCWCGAEQKERRPIDSRGTPIDGADSCCRDHDVCLELGDPTAENKKYCDRKLCQCVKKAKKNGQCQSGACKLAYAGIHTIFCIPGLVAK